MDARRFDALTKALAGHFPRRRLLSRLGIGGVAALAAGAGGGSVAAAQQASPAAPASGPTVVFSCEACDCGASNCCCLSGVVGGGVIQTSTGNDQIVLFASRTTAPPPAAAGFVRWIDPHAQGGALTLESVGPFTYEEVSADGRRIRGTMQRNGAGTFPFELNVVWSGPTAGSKNTASLAVGDQAIQGGTKSGFGYGATGTVVGGDFQILDNGPAMPKH